MPGRVSEDQKLHFQSFRAPQEHGTALTSPPLSATKNLIARNVELSTDWDLPFPSPIRQFQLQARQDLLSKALQYTQAYRDTGNFSDAAPFVISGHQPELFHPGVWFKNFVLSNLGERLSATVVNLIVDNDICGSESIKVPVRSAERIRTSLVPFDKNGPVIPFEQRQVIDMSTFSSFADRLARTIRPFVQSPSVKELWQGVSSANQDSGNLGATLAQSRHILEGTLGLNTLEVPLSHACRSQAFSALVSAIVSRIQDFQESYNRSVVVYRKAHQIRSTSHPVPELKVKDDWWESPFWIYSDSAPQRRAVYVRFTAKGIEFSDLHSEHFVLAKRNGEVDTAQLTELQDGHIKLRPRALTTTMFARLLLSDLFLHGIGGGKYDQLCDMIVRDFFRIEPPSIGVLSATYAPLGDTSPAEQHSEQQIKRDIRDTQFHPERFAEEGKIPQHLLDEKREILKAIPTEGSKKTWHDAMTDVNAKMSEQLRDIRTCLQASLQDMKQASDNHRILRSREYAFCIYPLQEMADTLSRLAQG